ncbi:MAG: hypothetical protein LBU14_04340 [Candidatus Peribacteria bacterium]|nr:hypothetical protein [Candidatus Peribacteria bacterium]
MLYQYSNGICITIIDVGINLSFHKSQITNGINVVISIQAIPASNQLIFSCSIILWNVDSLTLLSIMAFNLLSSIFRLYFLK